MIFPRSVGRYFWGDNLHEISLEKQAKYITQTLLEKGDTDAVRWLFNDDYLKLDWILSI